MAGYDSKCQFCGEEVGPPDERSHLALAEITIYPGWLEEDGPDRDDRGVRIMREIEPWQNEEDVANLSVHSECWAAWCDGVLAGKKFYRVDE